MDQTSAPAQPCSSRRRNEVKEFSKEQTELCGRQARGEQEMVERMVHAARKGSIAVKNSQSAPRTETLGGRGSVKSLGKGEMISDSTGSKGVPPAKECTGGQQKEDPGGLLPLDILRHCFLKLESIHWVVTCARVCHHWRAAVESEEMWQLLYDKWSPAVGPTTTAAPANQNPGERRSRIKVAAVPSHAAPKLQLARKGARRERHTAQWKETFKTEYDLLREAILGREMEGAVLQQALVIGRDGERRVLPGLAMQELATHLGLSFTLRINRGRPIGLQGKAAVASFPACCTVRCPPAQLPGALPLASLTSLKVTMHSARLMASHHLLEISGREVSRLLEPAWKGVRGGDPLQLHMVRGIPGDVGGGVLVVGTMTDDHSKRQQQVVVLLALVLHWTDVVPPLLGLPRAVPSRQPVTSLPRLAVSLQLHSFGKLLWHAEGTEGRWHRELREGADRMVMRPWGAPLLMKLEGGPLKVPWRCAAFSGELQRAAILTCTVWDDSYGIVCHSSLPLSFAPLKGFVPEGLGFAPEELDGGDYTKGQVMDGTTGLCIAIMVCVPPQSELKSVSGIPPMVVDASLEQYNERHIPI